MRPSLFKPTFRRRSSAQAQQPAEANTLKLLTTGVRLHGLLVLESGGIGLIEPVQVPSDATEQRVLKQGHRLPEALKRDSKRSGGQRRMLHSDGKRRALDVKLQEVPKDARTLVVPLREDSLGSLVLVRK